jgi:hypothetical protein
VTTSLGWRRLVGWIALIGAILVLSDALTGAQWLQLVASLLHP